MRVCLLVCLSVLLVCFSALGQETHATYAGSYDGDQVKASLTKGTRTVTRAFRVAGIDAPEVKGHQAYWQESRDALRNLLNSKEVVIVQRGHDTKWNRSLAIVKVGEVDVGLEQIRAGNAWFYRQYARSLTEDERASYAKAEAEARENKRGLWGQTAPVPPWQWRKGKR
jgi:micrococcal nuclease